MRFLIAFAFGLSLVSSTTAQEKNPVADDSKAQLKSNKSTDQTKGKASPAITPDSKPKSTATQTKENDREANPDSRIYQVKVLPEPANGWYIFSVVFSGLTSLIGIGTLFAVWKQRSVMKGQHDAMQAQLAAFIEGQRPKISADPHGNPAQDFANLDSPRVMIELHNTGLTTAYDCVYESWIEILPPPFVDFTPAVDYFPSQNRLTLHAKHKPMLINIPLRNGVTREQRSAIYLNQLDVCIRVKLTFRDAFSPNRRYANFGYVLDAQGFRFLPKYQDSN